MLDQGAVVDNSVQDEESGEQSKVAAVSDRVRRGDERQCSFQGQAIRHRPGPKLGQQVTTHHAEAVSTSVLVRQAYRAKNSGQHNASDITRARGLISRSVRPLYHREASRVLNLNRDCVVSFVHVPQRH